jgi:hypothetical protein
MYSPDTKFEWVQRMRDGGNVQRCHTMRMLQPPRVNAHSWGMVLVLLAVGCERAEPLICAVLHDVHEVYTGDTPAPAKWQSHMLTDGLLRLEHEYNDAHGISGLFAGLSEPEIRLINWADLFEFVQSLLDEAALGNTTVHGCIRRCVEVMQKRREGLLDAIGRGPFTFGPNVVAMEDGLFAEALPYMYDKPFQHGVHES